MRSFLIGVLLIPALLTAEPVQVEKKIVCDTVDNVFNSLNKEYQERPVWIGLSKDSQVTVLVNPKTNSWTIVQFNRQLACILEPGEGFKLFPEVLDKKSELTS